jgi:hypothetical protein
MIRAFGGPEEALRDPLKNKEPAMSQPAVILQAMRIGQKYRDIDLQAITRLSLKDVRRNLTLLEKNGIIEAVGEYFEKPGKRRKVYGTRQNELFA